ELDRRHEPAPLDLAQELDVALEARARSGAELGRGEALDDDECAVAHVGGEERDDTRAVPEELPDGVALGEGRGHQARPPAVVRGCAWDILRRRRCTRRLLVLDPGPIPLLAAPAAPEDPPVRPLGGYSGPTASGCPGGSALEGEGRVLVAHERRVRHHPEDP